MVLAELPLLYRVARRMTGDPTRAEDLVSQTLMLAARAWPGFDGRFPRSWLISILRNAHLGELRRPEVDLASHESDDVPDVGYDILTGIVQRLEIEAILAQVDRLPENLRLAVVLCDLEQLSYEEAATAMEIPIGTVRSRLHRGRRLIQKQLAALPTNEPHEVLSRSLSSPRS